MGNSVYFKFVNADEFVKGVRKRLTGDDLAIYTKITNESAIAVLSETRINCPVKTGTLRRSYRLFFEKFTSFIKGIAGGVLTEVDYAPYVEFKRKPHLFPAYYKEKPNYIERIREAFKKQVNP